MSSRFLENITLERSIELREPREEIIPDYKSSIIIDNFKNTMDNIEAKFEIIEELELNNQLDIRDDILRSQVMFSMSNLDFYMHEIVKYGILSIFKKERKKTKSYEGFAVNLLCVEKALENRESIDWLEEWINLKNKTNTFMATDKIKSAFSLISTKNDLFERVARKMNTDSKNLSLKLNSIYKRRNLIAHQSDRDEISGQLQEIDKEFVHDVISTIKDFVIYSHDEIVNDI